MPTITLRGASGDPFQIAVEQVGTDESGNPIFQPVQKVHGPKLADAYCSGETGLLLFEDRFEDGLCGWTWLMHQFSPVPGPVWSAWRGVGTGSALLMTGPVAPDDPSMGGDSTAIKRVMLPRDELGAYRGIVEFEVMLGWASDDPDHPAWWGVGIDTQRGDIGTRRQYYQLHFVNFDEDTQERVQQFRVLTSAGEVDVPGMKLRHWNEAKAGSLHLRLRVDILAERYVAAWLNGQYFDLSGFAGPNDTYVGEQSGWFDEGLNFSVDLTNRYDVSLPAMLHLDYARAVVL